MNRIAPIPSEQRPTVRVVPPPEEHINEVTNIPPPQQPTNPQELQNRAADNLSPEQSVILPQQEHQVLFLVNSIIWQLLGAALTATALVALILTKQHLAYLLFFGFFDEAYSLKKLWKFKRKIQDWKIMDKWKMRRSLIRIITKLCIPGILLALYLLNKVDLSYVSFVPLACYYVAMFLHQIIAVELKQVCSLYLKFFKYSRVILVLQLMLILKNPPTPKGDNLRILWPSYFLLLMFVPSLLIVVLWTFCSRVGLLCTSKKTQISKTIVGNIWLTFLLGFFVFIGIQFTTQYPDLPDFYFNKLIRTSIMISALLCYLFLTTAYIFKKSLKNQLLESMAAEETSNTQGAQNTPNINRSNIQDVSINDNLMNNSCYEKEDNTTESNLSFKFVTKRNSIMFCNVTKDDLQIFKELDQSTNFTKAGHLIKSRKFTVAPLEKVYLQKSFALSCKNQSPLVQIQENIPESPLVNITTPRHRLGSATLTINNDNDQLSQATRCVSRNRKRSKTVVIRNSASNSLEAESPLWREIKEVVEVDDDEENPLPNQSCTPIDINGPNPQDEILEKRDQMKSSLNLQDSSNSAYSQNTLRVPNKNSLSSKKISDKESKVSPENREDSTSSNEHICKSEDRTVEEDQISHDNDIDTSPSQQKCRKCVSNSMSKKNSSTILEKRKKRLERLINRGNTENSNSKTKNCFICMDSTPDSIFHPCGHGGFCFECAKNIIEHSPNCHYCRQTIKKVLQIDTSKEYNNIYKVKEVFRVANLNDSAVVAEYLQDVANSPPPNPIPNQ